MKADLPTEKLPLSEEKSLPEPTYLPIPLFGRCPGSVATVIKAPRSRRAVIISLVARRWPTWRRRHYYCDTCNLYYHEGCQKNQSKGRQAPLCPPCREKALAGEGGRKRRRVGPET